MIKKNKKTAFTLVELLVVIAIIGILSTLAVISLQNARSKARDAKRVADVRQIQTALELYYASEGKYPDDLKTGDSIESPDGTVYMPRFPQAPNTIETGCDSSEYHYQQKEDGAGYEISFCLGSNIGDIKKGENIAESGGIKEVVYVLTLLSESLPNGQVGSAYSGHTFGAIHGTKPYYFSVTSGTLPQGLNLDSNGQLSGTPNTYGQYNFSISVTDAEFNIDTQDFSLNIDAATLALGGTNPPNGTKNTSYPGHNFNASGGVPPYTFYLASGSLPAGLSLSLNGSLSGTPSAEGSSTFTIKVVDSLFSEASKQFSMSIIIPPFVCGNNFIDTRDGNIYPTVKIGEQCWMAKNLSYLPTVNKKSEGSTTDPRYYVYGYDGTDVAAAKAYVQDGINHYNTYGVLYNYPAATSSCPTGWHLPDNNDWDQLKSFLSASPTYYCGGNSNHIAKSLAATTLWDSNSDNCAIGNNLSANNSSGFTALPAGFRYSGGDFVNLSGYVRFWSASPNGDSSAWFRYLFYSYPELRANYDSRAYGFSVRCLLSNP